MHTAIRVASALALAASFVAGSTVVASAATPQTADVECLRTVVLPAQDGFTVPLPASSSNSSDCFLVIGDSGAGVSDLQAALKTCNGQSGLAVDGDFGTRTKAAVVAVQRAHGITADGGYGNQTRGVMSWPDNNSTKCTIPSHF
jgi:peptidoglycan hydrolase-like protein with peptidoglycan-binding domain